MKTKLLLAIALLLIASAPVRAQPYDPDADAAKKAAAKKAGAKKAAAKNAAPKKAAAKKAPAKAAATSQPAAPAAPAGKGSAKGTATTSSQPGAKSGAAHGGAAGAKKHKLDPYDPRLDTTGSPSLPPRKNRVPPPSAKAGETRPMPSYRGRPGEGITAGKVLVWVPRVLLYPAHLVLEYLVRKPVIWAFTRAEEHYVFQRIQKFFSFREGKSSVFPTAFFDFGLNPTVGFLMTNSDLWVKGHSLTIKTGFWDGWINVQATSSWKVFHNDTGLLSLRGQFYTRPDQVFTGVGPNTRFEDETFYRNRTGEVELLLRSFLTDLNRINISMLYRDTELADGFGPSIETLFDTRDDAVVPGFGEYRLLQIATRFELDSRSPDTVFKPGSGVRLEAFASFNFNPSDTDLHFLRYGGELAGFWDISGINHVLALRVYVELIEQTGDKRVPLPELIFLGGQEHMRGFLEGRLRGQSAFVATTSYQYPIWTFLDANLFAGIGNVFNGRLENFNFKRMYFNFGLGLRSNFSREAAIELAFAFGTNRFDSDTFKLETFRFVFGVNQGF